MLISVVICCQQLDRKEKEIEGLVGLLLTMSVGRGNLPQNDDLLQRQDIVKLKRCIYAAQVSTGNNVCIRYFSSYLFCLDLLCLAQFREAPFVLYSVRFRSVPAL